MAYNNIGVINMRVGKLEKAVKYLEKSIGIEQNNVFAYTNLGICLKKGGNLA